MLTRNVEVMFLLCFPQELSQSFKINYIEFLYSLMLKTLKLSINVISLSIKM